MSFDLGGLSGLSRLSTARTRSISAENFTGGKGQGGRATEGTGAGPARDLGQGWKVSPSIEIAPGATATLADIEGPGVLRHMWITCAGELWRRTLLRFYWDGDPQPAVQTPLGDFFCQGWGEYAQVSSVPVAVNPKGGMNCYWPMPFRRDARVTLKNLCDDPIIVYYQLDYELTAVPEDAAYFHAQWRRSNPVPYGQVHPILDTVPGAGHYVGTYFAWGVNNCGWWGEGEVKFYLDGDDEFPTICGTGTEDYVGGAWDWNVPGQGYTTYTTPYLGMHQVLKPDGLYRSQQRFGLYRWHIPDPVRFATDLRVTVQALGWRSGRRYLPLQDDVATTAFFYLDRTSTARPATPDADAIEVI